VPYLDTLFYIEGCAAAGTGVALLRAGNVGLFLYYEIPPRVHAVEMHVFFIRAGDPVHRVLHGKVKHHADVLFRHRAGKPDRGAGDVGHDSVRGQIELHCTESAGQLLLVDLAVAGDHGHDRLPVGDVNDAFQEPVAGALEEACQVVDCLHVRGRDLGHLPGTLPRLFPVPPELGFFAVCLVSACVAQEERFLAHLRRNHEFL